MEKEIFLTLKNKVGEGNYRLLSLSALLLELSGDLSKVLAFEVYLLRNNKSQYKKPKKEREI